MCYLLDFDFFVGYNVNMKNLKQILTKNLIFLRKKANLKQSELAEKLNYSDKTVSKWENGEVMPSIEVLAQIAELYNVTIDSLVHPIDEQNFFPTPKKDESRRNKIIITLLSISVVWIVATLVYVYANIISRTNLWIIFVWAFPISFVIGIVFSALWANKKTTLTVISLLIWSLIFAFFLQFWQYKLYALFLIGIPAQVVILLWGGLKRKKK